MILKQAKVLSDHPDLMKLRRGLVERSLWVTVLLCFGVIGLLTAAVIYYKLQSDNLPSTVNSDTFSKIGGKYLASVVSSKMNFSVRPCDDFYQFACGRFEKTSIIPEDSGSVNTINIIEGRVMAQLNTLLNNEINPKEIRPFKMAKQMYRQCLNTTYIEKNGLDFVMQKLNLTSKWPVLMGEDKWDESRWNSTDFFRFSVDYFIDTDLKNTSRRALYISAANLGLSRDILLRGFQDNIIKAYHRYMVDVSIFFGANKTQAENDYAKVLLFEMFLANITIPKEERRKSNKMYNPITIAELRKKYPFVDWLGYLNAKSYAGIEFNDSEVVIVQQPTYYDQLESVLNQTDKRTIANYVIWRDLADYIPYLTANLREMEFDFLKVITGKAVKNARWSDCVKSIAGMFNIAVSSMYVREYFRDYRIKEDITQITTEISSEFEKILHENDWMDKDTKQEALKKLRSMKSNIAYPIELMHDETVEGYYKNLQLNETNYLQSAINIDTHGKVFACSRFHKPVNSSDWVDHSTSIYVNANYNGKTNSIQIIAAMLQGHFYSADRPDYMNYAAIGYVIGHEMTHGFDDLGRLYDASGNLVDWWHPETKLAFVEKKKCIIEQYGNYTDSTINMNLNGVNTQGENIADNGGLKLAYRAYVSALSKSRMKDPMLPGLPFTPNQLFWISAAQTWCSIERPEIKKMMILTDNHALGRFRVLGTISNSREFSTDFKCAVDAPMNPPRKCEIW